MEALPGTILTGVVELLFPTERDGEINQLIGFLRADKLKLRLSALEDNER